jgi:hypothetical protein
VHFLLKALELVQCHVNAIKKYESKPPTQTQLKDEASDDMPHSIGFETIHNIGLEPVLRTTSATELETPIDALNNVNLQSEHFAVVSKGTRMHRRGLMADGIGLGSMIASDTKTASPLFDGPSYPTVRHMRKRPIEEDDDPCEGLYLFVEKTAVDVPSEEIEVMLCYASSDDDEDENGWMSNSLHYYRPGKLKAE